MEQLDALSLPPGFGFHPTDVELVSHYLKRKLLGQRIEFGLIPELDIYKHEPWDLSSKYTGHKSDTKWYFFTARDRKYPTGARSNRTTTAGYWKSTGKDRIIKQNNRVVGSKKTLVFHQGRPPAGKRTEWIMHEYYLDESECKDAPDAKDLFVLCRITKRDGCSTDAAYTPASAEVVPNGVEQSSGVVDPVVHDSILSPSENIVVSSNSNNNDGNDQQDDVGNWLKQLFSSSESSLLGPQFSPEPFGPIPAALKREPNGGFLREGSAEETSYLLPDDIQSILGTHDHENTQNLQFLEEETTGIDSFFCNFVDYDHGDDETGIVIRKRSTTASYDYPNDTDGSTINKYNLKSKLQVHLYKKEEKSLETASFTPKDGLVGEFENSEKIKGMNRKEPKSTMMPKRAKIGGFLGMSTLIFTAVLVAGIATLFCCVSNNCSIFS